VIAERREGLVSSPAPPRRRRSGALGLIVGAFRLLRAGRRLLE
jgi:hypothetical protein